MPLIFLQRKVFTIARACKPKSQTCRQPCARIPGTCHGLPHGDNNGANRAFLGPASRLELNLQRTLTQIQYQEPTRTLRVGGGAFAPVSPAVYNFEVSGLKVVQSWLGYRMKQPKGKKSSPLDGIKPESWTGDFTTELLELLWVLEATVAEYPRQERLLAAIVTKTAMKLPP